jgi:hypothetical protein
MARWSANFDQILCNVRQYPNRWTFYDCCMIKGYVQPSPEHSKHNIQTKKSKHT